MRLRALLLTTATALVIPLAGCGTTQTIANATTTTTCPAPLASLHATHRHEHLHSGYAPVGFVMSEGSEDVPVPEFQTFSMPGKPAEASYTVSRSFMAAPAREAIGGQTTMAFNGVQAAVAESGPTEGDKLGFRVLIAWHVQPDVVIVVNGYRVPKSEVVNIAKNVVYTRSDYPDYPASTCTSSGKGRIPGAISRADILARQPVVAGQTVQAKLIRIGDVKAVDSGIFGGCILQACDDDVVAWAVLRTGDNLGDVSSPDGIAITPIHAQVSLLDAVTGSGVAGGESAPAVPEWWINVTDYDA